MDIRAPGHEPAVGAGKVACFAGWSAGLREKGIPFISISPRWFWLVRRKEGGKARRKEGGRRGKGGAGGAGEAAVAGVGAAELAAGKEDGSGNRSEGAFQWTSF